MCNLSRDKGRSEVGVIKLLLIIGFGFFFSFFLFENFETFVFISRAIVLNEVFKDVSF